MKWQEPPPAKRGNPNRRRNSPIYRTEATALRAHPGDWALVFEDVSPSTAEWIRRGTYAAFRPAGAFEVAGRARPSDKGQKVDIYVRFVGDPE